MRLTAELPDGERYKVHQPIPLRLDVTNDEGVVVEVPDPVGHDGVPILHLRDLEAGEESAIHPGGDDGDPSPPSRPITPLPPNASRGMTLDLTDRANLLRPGRFEVRVEFWWDRGSWTSDPIPFEIEVPELGGVSTSPIHDRGSEFHLAAWVDEGRLLLRGIDATERWAQLWFLDVGPSPPAARFVASVAPPDQPRMRAWLARVEGPDEVVCRFVSREGEAPAGPFSVEHGLDEARIAGPLVCGWTSRGVRPHGHVPLLGRLDGSWVLRTAVVSPDDGPELEEPVGLPGRPTWARSTVRGAAERVTVLACATDEGHWLGSVRRRSIGGAPASPGAFVSMARVPRVRTGDLALDGDGRIQGAVLAGEDELEVVPFSIDAGAGAVGWPVPLETRKGEETGVFRVGPDGSPNLLLEGPDGLRHLRLGRRPEEREIDPLPASVDHLDLVFERFWNPRILWHEVEGPFHVTRVHPREARVDERPLLAVR